METQRPKRPSRSDRIVALMIGRGGSSLPDKNVLPVLGVPLLLYTAAAAKKSNYISRFYISSDCQKILYTAGRAGYRPIQRPVELSQPDSQSVDVVNHAIKIIEKDGPVDILVVQHANVATITEKIIDECIEEMLADNTYSAVVPSHEVQHYHPYRVKKLNTEGLLEPFFDFSGQKISGNRQELPTCLSFDHSIWVLNVERGIKGASGQPPWTCMGNRIKPYITVGCFDVHDLEDLQKTEEWVRKNSIAIPNFGA